MWPFTRKRRYKQIEGAVVITGGQVRWTERNMATLAEEGYKKNAPGYRAASLVAGGAASVPWHLYQGEKILEKHALLDLIEHPNKTMGRAEFIEAVFSHYQLQGNSYIRGLAPVQGPPKELWVLRPERVRVEVDKKGMVVAFKHTTDQNSTEGERFETHIHDEGKYSEVLHWKTFHPLDDYYGMSALEAAAYSIDQHNAGSEYNYHLLKNHARPSAVLSYKADEYQKGLSDEQYKRLKKEIKEKYQGALNTGRPILLEGGLTWQDISWNVRDTDWVEGRNVAAREICIVQGVPPMLCGVKGDATYANHASARLALWEDTIIPKLTLFRDALNNWLTPQFGEGLRLDFDVDEIPAIAAARRDNWEKIDRVRFLKIDEKREAAGYDAYEPGEGMGDVLLVDAMSVPLEMIGSGGSAEGEEGEPEMSIEDMDVEKATRLAYGRYGSKPSKAT